jgi:hypothetical protein
LTEIGRETEMLFQLGRGSNYRGVPHARFMIFSTLWF